MLFESLFKVFINSLVKTCAKKKKKMKLLCGTNTAGGSTEVFIESHTTALFDLLTG